MTILDMSLLQVIYINWSLQHFSQDSNLASHTTHAVCINFTHD